MKREEVNFATRQALLRFDEWNDVTGFFEEATGYYSEVIGLIEDAVKIGIKVGLYGISADLNDLDKSDE